ncbi:crotonase/enoyl-CoA hydratase family protein [Pontixanthobacter aquaemixtae]|uniref:Crotonase/enoyl-CoA hydratase family protein n=1 Tax=Pontixanthobacter aquaemixtae TaxID=1958940 RepID=A0A844ZV02_9SPHN|nr:crotonase/enoyl-CoA hydratase family protein [Pontixanthobacter aquaemixtae]MXO91833.1 crotonase/enoyl-CoA hydratase family protein [Pontixanthobacter aquaemixtae]
MQLQENDRISIELGDDGVAQVRLTRPDKMNALDPQMFERIIEAGHALHEMKGLRAVVLSGEGKSFCAGLDTSSFGAEPSPDAPPLTERTYGNSNKFQQVAMQWRKLQVPVIAAVHGVCFGGGLQIASGADIRVVTPDARLAIMEMKWGLVPDMAGFFLWRGLVRDDVLRELTYTNRQFTGEEAREYGLATFVDTDPVARATAIASEIANRNPHAIQGAKRLANAMVELEGDAILMEESIEQAAVMRTKNQIEAVMAGMAKRAPAFDDV